MLVRNCNSWAGISSFKYGDPKKLYSMPFHDIDDTTK